MATTSQIDLVRKSPGNLSGIALDLSVNAGVINSGDLCYWTGNGVASFGAGLTFNAALVALLAKRLGVARDANPLTAGGITNPVETIGIDASGTYSFKQTAGDTYTPFQEVTLGVDAQTITTAPGGPPANGAGLFTAGTVTGGTLSAGNHVVTMAYLTSLGPTATGTPSAAITATAGQGLIYDFDNAAAVVIPAWAIGFVVYVDGAFGAVYLSAPTADANITGATGLAVAPLESGIAIGRIYIPQTNISPAAAAPTSIAGVANARIQVILNKPWPASLAL